MNGEIQKHRETFDRFYRIEYFRLIFFANGGKSIDFFKITYELFFFIKRDVCIIIFSWLFEFAIKNIYDLDSIAIQHIGKKMNREKLEFRILLA